MLLYLLTGCQHKIGVLLENTRPQVPHRFHIFHKDCKDIDSFFSLCLSFICSLWTFPVLIYNSLFFLSLFLPLPPFLPPSLAFFSLSLLYQLFFTSVFFLHLFFLQSRFPPLIYNIYLMSSHFSLGRTVWVWIVWIPGGRPAVPHGDGGLNSMQTPACCSLVSYSLAELSV